MWDRIKRVVRSNLGRFRDDPFAPRSASDLKALKESLATVREQVTLLEQDLEKLRREEEILGSRIRTCLQSEQRETALKHAETLKKLREDKSRIERQLEEARGVCRRAEGVEQTFTHLDDAAEATISRLEDELDSPTPEPAPVDTSDSSKSDGSKTLGAGSGGHATADSGPHPVARKTIGADSGPQLQVDPDRQGREVQKTIGPEQQRAEKAPIPASGDLLDELERLGRLRERGVLTQDEFERAKRKLLG